MIVVIADDLTGAAELAGIGLRYTEDVKVVTEDMAGEAADMLVISTDTRSMSKAAAITRTAEVTTRIASLSPELIYKKVDSALRGYVVEEIAEHLKILQLKKALVVPANPSLGRKIIDGVYYLNDQPIHLTGFSKDPEFPVATSLVARMVSPGITPVYVMNHQQPFPALGMVIGEAACDADLKVWAQKRPKDVLLAGGSAFFNAIMDSIQPAGKDETLMNVKSAVQPELFVCGSAYAKSIELVSAVKEQGGPVSYMPREIVASGDSTESAYEDWRDEVIALLQKSGRAIIAIDPDSVTTTNTAASVLRERTAALVHNVYHAMPVNELFIEGGSTATAIIRKLAWRTFYPVQEISAGVVRMRVQGSEGLHLTIKPGSYAWSKEIWTF